jgi:hypothetical protein
VSRRVLERAKRLLVGLRSLAERVPGLRTVPRPVRRYYLKAWAAAMLHDDGGAVAGAAWPHQAGALLAAAGQRTRVVELGTGKAWTTVVLALHHPDRRVVSYDTYVWPTRERYLRLAPESVRERIELRRLPAESGPAPGDGPVDLLFIDSSHEHDETLASFAAWSPALTPDAVVVFHDYTNPQYPGVRTAVEELGLHGETLFGDGPTGMFVWRRDGAPV